MRRLLVVSLAALCFSTSAFAEFSGGKVVIGVMGDQSGVVADVGGPGSILAARMAVEDFGGSVGGTPIEIITADHQNKPEHYDVLVTLSTPGEATRLDDGPGSGVMSMPWSLCGLPTVSLPLLHGAHGLPIGIQLIGPRGVDRDLLQAAAWLVRACADSSREKV